MTLYYQKLLSQDKQGNTRPTGSQPVVGHHHHHHHLISDHFSDVRKHRRDNHHYHENIFRKYMPGKV